MSNLSIRNLDKTAYELLKIRAANHGVSMEEEARQIIYRTVSAPKKITAIFQKNFGHKNGVDLKLQTRRPHQPLDFSE